MSVQHRQAEHNDLDLIYEIQCRSFKPAFHESIDIFARILDKYPKGCFMIYQDDNPAGYLVSHPDYLGRKNYEEQRTLDGNENALFIHDLCIDPEFQGQGIARESARFIEGFARDKKFDAIIGIAIAEAQSFWIKQGFTMGHLHQYCGEDARVMSKKLV